MMECRVAEARLKPLDQRPVLSVVVPTWERVPEMVMAVESLACQLTDGLENRVEIIISDNASGPEAQSAIRALADRFPSVSYMMNAENQGGIFQLFAACWRSRGEWTWTFGSDDLLLPGGIAHIVSVLEGQQPDFLTMNRKVCNADLSVEIYAELFGIPDRTFKSFADLMCAVGFHQVAFLSASLERTDRARAIEPWKYLKIDTQHQHVLGYLEKHKQSKSCYSCETHLVHRTQNSHFHDYYSANLRDIGWVTPIAIMDRQDLYGIADDFFEKINGDGRINSYGPPKFTFVDEMFRSMLNAIGRGVFMRFPERQSIKDILSHCRPDRGARFQDIWLLNEETRFLYEDLDRKRSGLAEQQAHYEARLADIRAKALQVKGH